MKLPALSALAASFPTVEVEWEDMLTWRYRYGGRSADGIDCLGIVLEILHRAGIGLPDVQSSNALEFDGNWVEVSDPDTLYDVIEMRRESAHVAIVTTLGRALSAAEKKGVHAHRVNILKRIEGVRFWRLRPEVLP